MKIKILLTTLLIITIPYFASAKQVKNYIKNTYNRYSNHFDQHGWNYSQPNYNINNKEAQTARELLMFASYYKFKKSKTKTVQSAINRGYQEIQNRPLYTQSFKDSIAHFLTLRLLEKNNKKIYLQIKKSLNKRHKIHEIENRTVISAVLDTYLTKQLYKHKKISKKKRDYLLKKNQQKLNRGLEQSIDQNYWYAETNKKDFSVHYHTLTAYMLMFYGDLTKDDYYLNIAHEMTENIRKLSFKNGFLEAKIGTRPIGLGAQTYLMLGLLNKRFNYKDYNVYLKYSKHRFFSDPNYPNRLEFHSTKENTRPKYHDDIGFSLIAEIAQINKQIKKTKLKKHPLFLKNKISDYQDNRFTIQNLGGIIKVNDKEYKLGSFGNWSKIVKIEKE